MHVCTHACSHLNLYTINFCEAQNWTRCFFFVVISWLVIRKSNAQILRAVNDCVHKPGFDAPFQIKLLLHRTHALHDYCIKLSMYSVQQQNKGTKVGLLHTTLERSTGGWWAWPVGVARFSSPPKSTSPGVVMCQKCLYLPLLGSAKQEGGHKLLLTKSQKA